MGAEGGCTSFTKALARPVAASQILVLSLLVVLSSSGRGNMVQAQNEITDPRQVCAGCQRLSRGKPATLSPTTSGASLAVDGNARTSASVSCYSNDCSRPYWYVDLGASFLVKQVSVVQISMGPEYALGFEIRVGDQVPTSFLSVYSPVPDGQTGINPVCAYIAPSNLTTLSGSSYSTIDFLIFCPNSTQLGRYVSLQNTYTRVSYPNLALKELEVFGLSAPSNTTQPLPPSTDPPISPLTSGPTSKPPPVPSPTSSSLPPPSLRPIGESPSTASTSAVVGSVVGTLSVILTAVGTIFAYLLTSYQLRATKAQIAQGVAREYVTYAKDLVAQEPPEVIHQTIRKVVLSVLSLWDSPLHITAAKEPQNALEPAGIWKTVYDNKRAAVMLDVLFAADDELKYEKGQQGLVQFWLSARRQDCQELKRKLGDDVCHMSRDRIAMLPNTDKHCEPLCDGGCGRVLLKLFCLRE